MAVYNVQGPDGTQHQIQGPDGASDEQIIAAAQQAFGGGTPAQAAPAPPTPEQAAFAAGRQRGTQENAASAGISQAAQQGTLGLQNYINAGTRYVAQRLAGVPNADSFSSDLAYSRGMSEGEAEGSPTASTIGGTVGTFLGGAGLAKGTKLIPGGQAVTRFLAPKAGQGLSNIAKLAGAGATVGGVQALSQGQPLPQAAETAAVSGVAAPVAGRVAQFGLNKLQGASQTAMQALAKTLDETPATLQAAYNAYQNITGQLPSIADLVGLKSQGKLRALAGANEEIGQAARTAADIGGAPLHEQLAALADRQATKPQNTSDLTARRDQEMNDAMNTPHPQTGVMLKDEPINDPQMLLKDPLVNFAIRPNEQFNARLGGASPLRLAIDNDQVTVGDLDTIRQRLRDVQNQLASPAPGSAHMKDADLAKAFGDKATQIEQLGTNQVGDYGAALQNYRLHNRYIDTFNHAVNGNAVTDLPKDNALLTQSLKEAQMDPNTVPANKRPFVEAAQNGYAHGQALYQGQQALRAIAPPGIKEQEGPGAATLLHGIQGFKLSSPNHLMQAIKSITGNRLPVAVQSKIADMLLNPQTAQQGINNLRRAGVTADNLSQIAAGVGLTASANAGRYTSNNE